MKEYYDKCMDAFKEFKTISRSGEEIVITQDVFLRLKKEFDDYYGMDTFNIEQSVIDNNHICHLIENEYMHAFSTKDFINLIYEECKLNVWFFFKNIVKIPQQGGGTSSFKWNIGTYTLVKMYENGRSCCLLNPRQTLQTTTLYFLYLYTNFCTGCNCSFNGMKANNIHTFDHLRSLLPWYITTRYPERVYKRINFINDFEYMRDTSYLRTNNTNVLVFGVSTVNPGFNRKSFNFKVYNAQKVTKRSSDKIYLVKYPIEEFFDQDRINEFKQLLPEDAFNREILRIES